MSRNFCNFEVPTKKYKSPMPNNKGTNVFSEIGKFFKEKDATSAMNAIMDMMDALSLSEKRLFGIGSRCNCKLSQLQLLGLLMLFPCFMIRNAYNYASSSLFGVYSCKSRSSFSYSLMYLLSQNQAFENSSKNSPICLASNFAVRASLSPFTL